MRSHRSFASLLTFSLLALALLAAASAAGGKGAKRPPKSAPTDQEPWVAGYTLTQWIDLYRTGNDGQKERAAQMIAWCCTQRQSAAAAEALIEVLDDARHRLAACQAFARMNFEGRAAVRALVPWASRREKSTETRLAALDALGSIGVTRPGVLDVLLEGLLDRDDAVRRTAGYAISRIGPDARPLVPALIAALKDTEPVVAESAAAALSGIGPAARDAAPALCAALQHPNYLVRRHAAEALARLHSDDPAVHQALCAAVKDKERGISGGAVWALHFSRSIDDDVIDTLCWALRHGDASTRFYAANAMSEHGVDAPRTIEPLVAALADAKTRRVAAAALGKRRPVTETTLAAMMAAFEQGHYERIAIANALAEMGPAAESTVRRLKEALKERKAEGGWSYELIHVAVADALWKINKDRDVIPLLTQLARYPYDHHVTGGAMNALGDIGPEASAAVPALLAALKAPREAWGAARALLRIGAKEGEPALQQLLAAPDREDRLPAAFTLWELRRDPKALAELADVARTHRDRHTRRRAVLALAQAPPDTPGIAAHLTAALADDCPYIKVEAAKALPRFAPAARDAIPTLARLLAGDSWSAANQAAQTLGAFGAEAAPALPALRKAAEDEFLRTAAREAIRRIER